MKTIGSFIKEFGTPTTIKENISKITSVLKEKGLCASYEEIESAFHRADCALSRAVALLVEEKKTQPLFPPCFKDEGEQRSPIYSIGPPRTFQNLNARKRVFNDCEEERSDSGSYTFGSSTEGIGSPSLAGTNSPMGNKRLRELRTVDLSASPKNSPTGNDTTDYFDENQAEAKSIEVKRVIKDEVEGMVYAAAQKLERGIIAQAVDALSDTLLEASSSLKSLEDQLLLERFTPEVESKQLKWHQSRDQLISRLHLVGSYESVILDRLEVVARMIQLVPFEYRKDDILKPLSAQFYEFATAISDVVEKTGEGEEKQLFEKALQDEAAPIDLASFQTPKHIWQRRSAECNQAAVAFRLALAAMHACLKYTGHFEKRAAELQKVMKEWREQFLATVGSKQIEMTKDQDRLLKAKQELANAEARVKEIIHKCAPKDADAAFAFVDLLVGGNVEAKDAGKLRKEAQKEQNNATKALERTSAVYKAFDAADALVEHLIAYAGKRHTQKMDSLREATNEKFLQIVARTSTCTADITRAFIAACAFLNEAHKHQQKDRREARQALTEYETYYNGMEDASKKQELINRLNHAQDSIKETDRRRDVLQKEFETIWEELVNVCRLHPRESSSIQKKLAKDALGAVTGNVENLEHVPLLPKLLLETAEFKSPLEEASKTIKIKDEVLKPCSPMQETDSDGTATYYDANALDNKADSEYEEEDSAEIDPSCVIC